MNFGLAEKTALVTGSTAGIGFAIAQALAAEGARVIVNGRTQDRVDAAVARLNGARGVAADVGTAEGVRALVEAVPDVDVLVNNAGIFEPKEFDAITDEDWQRFFNVNVMSGVRLSRHYLRGMRQRNWGRIIFISSESAVQIPPEMIHYGFTKTAQLSIARGIAETTAGTGITVNSVLPGPTASEGVSDFVRQLASQQGTDVDGVEREFFRSMRPTSLLKRFERPEEIASIVTFVASQAASAINGAAVRADGGVIRAIV